MLLRRNVLLFAIIIGNHLLSNAQSRFPIKPNSVWRINNEYCCNIDSLAYKDGVEHYKYFVNGDTLIGNYTYFKLYKTGIMYLDVPFKIENKYMGAMRDEANKFFFIAKEKDTEGLLYDFNLKKGDPVGNFEVWAIDTLTDGRKRFLIDVLNVHCGSANTIIEGVGWLGGLLEGNSCYDHPGIKGTYLVCYSEGNETKFLNTKVTDRCKEIPDHSPPANYPDITITVAHHNLIVEFSSNPEDCNFTVFNLLGKPVLSGRIVNAKSAKFNIGYFPSGIYIAKFENKNRFYSFKFFKEN